MQWLNLKNKGGENKRKNGNKRSNYRRFFKIQLKLGSLFAKM